MDDTNDILKRLQALERAQSALPTITANELLDKQFPPQPELVEGFLRAGTYLLVGAPKLGKSFLMAQLCACVAGGLPFLDQPTHPGTVLYLALEDTESRMQERLVRMFGPGDLGPLHLGFRIRDAGELLADLEGFLKEHPDTGLVVIDTLQCVRQAGGTDYSYSSDYKAIQPFKALADRHHIALLLVHHTRKDQSDENTFNMISGTNGLLGAADGAYVLYRPKPQGDAILDFAGRDQPRSRMVLRFDGRTCLWQAVSREEGLAPEPEPLLDALPEIVGAGWQGTATQLAGLLRARDPTLDYAPNALTRKLNALTGRLEQEAGIRYTMKRTADSRELSFQTVQNDDHDGNDAFPDAV